MTPRGNRFSKGTPSSDSSFAMAVLSGGWERLNNSPTQEHATALIEIAKIATHRFDEKVANANPIHSARTRHLES